MNCKYLNDKTGKQYYYEATDSLISSIKFQRVNDVFIVYKEKFVSFFFNFEKKIEALEIIKYKIDPILKFEVFLNEEKIGIETFESEEIFEKKILESKETFFELIFLAKKEHLLASAAIIVYPVYNDYPDNYFFEIEFEN